MGSMQLASRCAYAGAALFVALIVAFHLAGANASATGWAIVIGVVAVSSHLILLPVVGAIDVPSWARAGGYAWIAIDVMLNVATVNGADGELMSALRLGGHVPAALWIAFAASRLGGAAREVGALLAAMLTVHAFASPWIPMWVIYIPFVTIPVWLALAGRALGRGAGAT
jgi:hypothetical protein